MKVIVASGDGKMPMTLQSSRPAGREGDAGAAAAGESLVAPSRPGVDPIIQPIYGRIASNDRRAGFLAAAAIAERLSRTAGSVCLAFDDYLRDLCVDLAVMSDRSGSPTLTCTASEAQLPVGPAITLGLIAEELVNNALVHALPDRGGGRIMVGFSAGPEAWLLTVEDSGIVGQPGPSRRGNGLMIARLLLLQLDGTLEMESGTIGGTRCAVRIPRPRFQA